MSVLSGSLFLLVEAAMTWSAEIELERRVAILPLSRMFLSLLEALEMTCRFEASRCFSECFLTSAGTSLVNDFYD